MSNMAANSVSEPRWTVLHRLIGSRSWNDTLRRLETDEGKEEARVIGSARGMPDGDRLPLLWACECRAPLEVVDALISAFPEGVTSRNESRGTPFLSACAWGASAAVVKLILQLDPEGPQIPAPPGLDEVAGGSLPIHLACTRDGEDALEVINILIDAFPDGVKRPNEEGNLPLHEACQWGADISIVKAILKAYPEGAGIAGDDGNLPLHYAWGARSMSATRLLTFAYPDAAKTQNSRGELPLHIACLLQHEEQDTFMKHLIRAFPEGACTRDEFGRLPIARVELVVMANFKKIKLLLLAAYHGEADKRTQLLHACAAAGEDCPLEVFLDVAAEHPNQLREVNADGNLPLHLGAAWVPWKQDDEDDEEVDGGDDAEGGGRNAVEFSTQVEDSGEDGENGTRSPKLGRLETLLLAYPEGALVRNGRGEVPLLSAFEAGRPSDSEGMWKLLHATLPIVGEGEDALCLALMENFALFWIDALYVVLRQGFLARNLPRALAKAEVPINNRLLDQMEK